LRLNTEGAASHVGSPDGSSASFSLDESIAEDSIMTSESITEDGDSFNAGVQSSAFDRNDGARGSDSCWG